MGLLTKEVEIKIWHINSKHYSEKGYKFNLGDIIKVKVEDLLKGSKFLVDVQCDYCGIVRKGIKYNNFTKLKSYRESKNYYCQSCNAKVNNRLPIEEVIKRVESLQNGYKLLNPNDYENHDSVLKISCDKNHEYETTMASVQQGCKCNVCWDEINKIRWIGEGNPRYNPELTERTRWRNRDTLEVVEWRRSVYERDNFTCQCCGQYQGNLHAHHLDGYDWAVEKRVDVDNGITLCSECHKEFHGLYGYGNNTRQQTEEFLIKVGKLTEQERLKIKELAKQNNRTKIHLDYKEVMDIKWILSNTDLTQEEIKSIFNLKGVCITYIKSGKSYSYIELNEDYIPSLEIQNKINQTILNRKNKVNGNSILSIEDVKAIKKMLYEGEKTYGYIAKIYGVSSGAIKRIKNGETWKNISISEVSNEQLANMGRDLQEKGERRYNSILSDMDVYEIRTELSKGEKPVNLAKKYGVKHGYIYDIKRNRVWKHIRIC